MSDAAIDLTKTSWGVPQFGRVSHQKGAWINPVQGGKWTAENARKGKMWNTASFKYTCM